MSEATQTLQLIESGKNKKLLSLVPKGQSPKLYLDLIKSQVMAPDASGKPRSDEDLLLFLYVCKRTGLDPLTKQIYAVFRWNSRLGKEVMTIQTGIDGMRLIAQRSGAYAGQDDVKFTPEDESSPHPIKATVTVYKVIGGQRVGFTATARWNEYVQVGKDGNPTGLWFKMSYHQLGKCAEALVLRKGFPNELSGIYSEEEMAQANNPLAGLPAPEKFTKEDKPVGDIEVVHGAPADSTPVISTPEVAQQENISLRTNGGSKQQEEPKPAQPQKELKPSNLSELRAKLKKMQERAKDDEKKDAELEKNVKETFAA